MRKVSGRIGKPTALAVLRTRATACLGLSALIACAACVPPSESDYERDDRIVNILDKSTDILVNHEERIAALETAARLDPQNETGDAK